MYLCDFSELSISSIYLFTYWLFGIQSSRNAKKFHHLCFYHCYRRSVILAFGIVIARFILLWFCTSLFITQYFYINVMPSFKLLVCILATIIGLIAFQCNLLESNNLWNYYVVIIGIVLLGNYLVSACQWGIRKLKNE